MSAFAYLSLGLAAGITLLAYWISPDAQLALTLLPLLLVLGGIPVLMNIINRRYVEKLELRHVKVSRIKDLVKKEIGTQVRINGTVAAVSHKWLNRPQFKIVDPSGDIGVHMFVAPREPVYYGDQVEIVGTLRWTFGFGKKERKIWGLRLVKMTT